MLLRNSENPVILEGSGFLDGAAVTAAARWMCSGAEPPCDNCSDCRKTFAGTHPDVTVLDIGPDKELTVGEIRKLRAEIHVRPFEGQAKVYIIAHGQNLNAASQSVLLKMLEEPPEYARFLLLVNNSMALMPTVLSRCELVRTPQPDFTPEDEDIERASAVFNALEDEWQLVKTVLSWDKLSRVRLAGTLKAFLTRIDGELRAGKPRDRLLSMADAANGVLDDLELNAGVGTACGKLIVELWEARL